MLVAVRLARLQNTTSHVHGKEVFLKQNESLAYALVPHGVVGGIS